MNNATSSANCNDAESDESVVAEVPDFDDGFLLMNDHLVPYCFIESVADHLESTVVHRAVVMSVREIVGEAFWQELDIREQQVIGPVLLLLIETGRVALCCPKGH